MKRANSAGRFMYLYRLLLISILLCIFMAAGCSEKNTISATVASASAMVTDAPTPTVTATPKPLPIDELADENKIKEDLNINSGYMTKDIPITTVQIEKRQTNKESKQDFVFCMVSSANATINATSYYKLTYNFYDVGGWILDTVEVNKEEEWLYQPLVGVGLEQIKKSLIGQAIKVDGLWEHTGGKSGGKTATAIFNPSDWVINEGDIKSVSISLQNTDLANKTDSVTVAVSLHSKAATVTGSMILEFSFEEQNWTLRNLSTPADFAVKSSASFNISNSKILKDIKKYQPKIGTTVQIGFDYGYYSKAKIGKKYLCNKGLTVKVVLTWSATGAAAYPIEEYGYAAVLSYEYKDSKWVLSGGEWGDKSGKLKIAK